MPESPSRIGRILRTVFWALFIAFVFGFVIGIFLRRELDRPVRYIGARFESGPVLPNDRSTHSPPNATMISAAAPCDIGDTLPRIFMPCHHEEEV